MFRNIVVTLACLGAGITPSIANDVMHTEESVLLTSSEMEWITAGNAASLIRENGSLRASAEFQDANSSFSSTKVEALSVFVSDGQGGGDNVLELRGSAITPTMTKQYPAPEPPQQQDPVVPPAPVYANRAAQALAERLAGF